MYLLQVWFNLSDEGADDAIYDSYTFSKFMNIDFMEEQVLDATKLLKFRHLLEENHLGEEFFKEVNRIMEESGHIMHGGKFRNIMDTLSLLCVISHAGNTKAVTNFRTSKDYERLYAMLSNTTYTIIHITAKHILFFFISS